MYLHENLTPTPSPVPVLLGQRPPQRLKFSELKDIHCHCPPFTTQSQLASLVGWRSVVLSCNSLLDEKLDLVLQKLSLQKQKIFLEVHATTAVLDRWLGKINELPHELSLIVIVETGDVNLLKKLHAIDDKVAEYRIVPSCRYTPEFYLRELPSFIQTKATWMLIHRTSQHSPFLSVDELHTSLEKIKHWPLTELKISPTQPYQDHSSRLLPLSDSVAWFSRSPEMLAQHHALIKKHTLNLTGRKVTLFVSPQELQILQKIKTKRAQKNQNFFMLNHALIPIDVWSEYTSSKYGLLTDHFTWSQFLIDREIDVEWVEVSDSTGSYTLEQFQNECREHYTRQPDKIFYRDFFVFLGESLFWRSAAMSCLYFWQLHQQRQGYQKFARKCELLLQQLADYHFEVKETHNLAKKILYRSLNKMYWGVHHGLWKCTEIFWFFYRVYWRCMDGFWWLYTKLIAPTWGFIKTLYDQPPEWRQEPLVQQVRLRSQHVVKKIGWLLLKAFKLK